jgi:threonine synthase
MRAAPASCVTHLECSATGERVAADVLHNLYREGRGRLPTGSFKARGVAMAVSMAKAFGVRRIAMPTNGNAGAALAAYGARAGIADRALLPGGHARGEPRRDARARRRGARVDG